MSVWEHVQLGILAVFQGPALVEVMGVAIVDHPLHILIALEHAGLAGNTIVVYFSDHSDWLGDHGLVLKGPMHYEGLLRVPLIARGPAYHRARRSANRSPPSASHRPSPTTPGPPRFSARSTEPACVP